MLYLPKGTRDPNEIAFLESFPQLKKRIYSVREKKVDTTQKCSWFVFTFPLVKPD
jgi:hypothetical protein